MGQLDNLDLVPNVKLDIQTALDSNKENPKQLFEAISYEYQTKTNQRDKLIIKAFTTFCIKTLNIKNETPKIILLNKDNQLDVTTGAFDRQDNVWARFEGRAIIDVLRTIAHELVHMQQIETGKFGPNDPVQDVGGYIENEANAMAGELIKTFKNEYDCKWIYKI